MKHFDSYFDMYVSIPITHIARFKRVLHYVSTHLEIGDH